MNDEHGHLGGDSVLRGLADRLSHEIRREELLARYDGEEFAVVFPDTSAADAYAVCERLRTGVEGGTIPFGNKSISVTISIGTATSVGETSVEELVKEADTRLYEAKQAGRNTTRPAPGG